MRRLARKWEGWVESTIWEVSMLRACLVLSLAPLAFSGIAGCGSNEESDTVTVREPSPATTTTTTKPDEPAAVTGPAECGENSSGANVVVNAGTIACSEAVKVSNSSTGPNSASGPPGWDCSQFAQTVEGADVPATLGFGCGRSDGTRISFVAGAGPGSTPTPGGPCPNPAGTAPMHELVAAGVDCARASRVVAAWAANQSCGTQTCSAAGFDCTGSQPSPAAEYLAVECENGGDSVSFNIGG